ncbi:hypothetical protein RYX36_008425 [Vicia faba]
MKSSYLIFTAFMALASCALAFDPSPLQDFCVAINDTNNGVFVNGKFCKDPKLATANDFFFSVKEGNTSNSLGSKVTPVAVNEILGLNTLDVLTKAFQVDNKIVDNLQKQFWLDNN